MRLLYKIWSGYDSFYPKKIPERLIAGRDLHLVWQRYLDSVEVGNEVWVYFYGPHRFTAGVYVIGFVRAIDSKAQRVTLRVRRSSTENPLTDEETSRRVGATVAPHNRQVFLYPEQWQSAPHCTLHDSIAESCRNRACDNCATWRSLPVIRSSITLPHRLPGHLITGFAPAYWVIPSRCYLHRIGTVASAIRHTSEVFMRFKVGDKELTYPLALGMYTVLSKRNLVDFDAVIPIPLSPDKEQAGEINRTKLLGLELGRLLGSRVAPVLSLNCPISKHKLRIHQGLSAPQFEARYAAALVVDAKAKDFRQVLLIDDVCTEGSTLKCAIAALRSTNPEMTIAVATAGQMIVKAVTNDDAVLLQGDPPSSS